MVSPLAAITAANTGGSTTYTAGCAITGTDSSGIAAAVAAAKAADLVVLGLGITQAVESESHARAPGPGGVIVLNSIALTHPA